MNFLDIFRAQNDHLVIGYLMGTDIFEFRPNLCQWQLSNPVLFMSLFGHAISNFLYKWRFGDFLI